MKFRRRQRWLRRFALAFAFATALVAAKVSPAWAKFDDGGASGKTVVSVGGWSGAVDPESGIPLSAGIPHGDEQFLSGASTASTASTAPSGDEIAIANAMADRKHAAAENVHDPYLTDIYVRQGESLGGPDGSTTAISGEPFVAGVTDFPTSAPVATRPDDQAMRFTVPAEPAITGVGTRPDDRAHRFTPGDGVSTPRVEVAGSSRDWDGILTFGLGAIALGLALGLAFGYLRRPRLAL